MPTPNTPKKATAKKAAPPPRGAQVKNALVWAIIVLAVIGIIWMMMSAPKEKVLNCSSGGPTSLIGFGSCQAE